MLGSISVLASVLIGVVLWGVASLFVPQQWRLTDHLAAVGLGMALGGLFSLVLFSLRITS